MVYRHCRPGGCGTPRRGGGRKPPPAECIVDRRGPGLAGTPAAARHCRLSSPEDRSGSAACARSAGRGAVDCRGGRRNHASMAARRRSRRGTIRASRPLRQRYRIPLPGNCPGGRLVERGGTGLHRRRGRDRPAARRSVATRALARLRSRQSRRNHSRQGRRHIPGRARLHDLPAAARAPDDARYRALRRLRRSRATSGG